MSAEKFVKNEAKASLAGGNWVKAIIAVMIGCFIPMLAMLVSQIGYMIASPDGEVSVELFEASPLLAIFFVVFQLIAVVSVVVLSPIFVGCARLFCCAADGKKTDVADVFYFFETKSKYASSVKFMLNILVKAILTFICCSIPAIFAYALGASMYNDAFAQSDNLDNVYALYGTAGLLMFAGFVVAVFILHRYIFAAALYSYYGYSEKNSFSIGAAAAKQHNKELIKLTLSFIPWILLLIFVVPFIYVYPYMFCSYFVSVKYLFAAMGIQAQPEKTSDLPSNAAPVGISSQVPSSAEPLGISNQAPSSAEPLGISNQVPSNAAPIGISSQVPFNAAPAGISNQAPSVAVPIKITNITPSDTAYTGISEEVASELNLDYTGGSVALDGDSLQGYDYAQTTVLNPAESFDKNPSASNDAFEDDCRNGSNIVENHDERALFNEGGQVGSDL